MEKQINKSQPNWGEAPAWADFWTRDISGVSMWWKTKPIFDGRMGIWMNEDDSRRARGTDWPILRQRPIEEQEGNE